MKIAIFSHEYPPLNGGAGTYVNELSVALASLGHSVRLVVGDTLDSRGDNVANNYARDVGIKIDRYPWIYSSKLWFIKDINLYKSILTKMVDIDLLIFANYTSHIVAHRVRQYIPTDYMIILHGDDIDYFCQRRRLKDRIMISKKHMNNYFKGAQKIISVSKYLEKIFLSYMPELKSKSQIVLHGIRPPGGMVAGDLARCNKLLSQNSSFNEKSIILTYVSRFSAGKGQDLMIRVFKELIKYDSRYFLVFIGDGATKLSVETLATQMNLTTRIFFTGSTPRMDVYNYLSMASLNIFLSKRYGETFGIVNIESMAVGTPVFALETGGVPEAIDDGITGVILKDSDPVHIADQIHSLLSDTDQYKKMGENAQNVAYSYFNAQRMASETIN
jgi:glycosyltransferase involved in cell wall biosynthesis